MGSARLQDYVHNEPENEFPTGQAEYLESCEHLGSCLVM